MNAKTARVVLSGLVNVDPFNTGRVLTCDLSTLAVQLTSAQRALLKKIGPGTIKPHGNEHRSTTSLARRGIVVRDGDSYRVTDRYMLLARAAGAE